MSSGIRLELQPRLQAIADWVSTGAKLADIGTDHGYLPVWLLQEQVIETAIATDINRLPLLHAKRSADAYGVTLDLRECDGLRGVREGEADTVIIAGMGGETIIHILQEAPWTRDGVTLLLQPMTKAELLRPWLAENGYCIRREQLVEDKDIIYPVLETAGGAMAPPSPGQACYGYSDECAPLFSAYLQRWIKRTRLALEGMRSSTNQDLQPRQKDLERLLEELEQRSGGRP